MQIKVNRPIPTPPPATTYDVLGLTAQQLGLIVAVLGAVPTDEYNIAYAEWERLDAATADAGVPNRLRELPEHIKRQLQEHFR